MHELMFQAGVKGMSERSELIPCTVYRNYKNVQSHNKLETAARERVNISVYIETTKSAFTQ